MLVKQTQIQELHPKKSQLMVSRKTRVSSWTLEISSLLLLTAMEETLHDHTSKPTSLQSTQTNVCALMDGRDLFVRLQVAHLAARLMDSVYHQTFVVALRDGLGMIV